MKLLEYQAKELFDQYGLATPKGVVLSSGEGAAEAVAAAGLDYPVVVKAQVQVGGRGKAGGVRFAQNPEELAEIVGALLFSSLKGIQVRQLLVVEKVEMAAEWYLSILLDRDAGMPMVIFSPCGGVDIEETARENPGAILKVPVNPLVGVADYTVQYLVSKSGIGGEHLPTLKNLLCGLYRLFTQRDCLLAEINPVAVGKDGTLAAVDGKVDVDDSALQRHADLLAMREAHSEPPLVTQARAFRFLYIPVGAEGRVAVMSNGSGMLMSMIDLLSKKEISVACALDLGGGATKDRIREAVRIVLSTPGVDTLFICIFGGITRCDEVAEGVRLALEEGSGGSKVVVRMEGTNKEVGQEIIGRTPQAVSAGGIVEGVRIVSEMLSASAGRRDAK